MAAEPITVPGVYDIPAEDYHADPVPDGSLSSSGARRLLPPSCPALFKQELEHGQGHKRAWDIGHAAHLLVLGEGPELVTIDADNYRTKAAQQARDEAYEAGQVPLLKAEREQVEEMAEALRAHPVASALFNPLGPGKPEQSLFWIDGPTGIWRRARLDWLPAVTSTGRLIVPDYKTTRDASPEAIQKAIYSHGYHCQAPWYLDAAQALDLAADDAAFIFVFQDKQPPYLVTPVELDVVALKIGRALNRQAIELYAACRKSGHWPGFTDSIELLPLPGWAEAKHLAEIS